jgi:beta-glucosidase
VNWFRFYNPADTASTGKSVTYAQGCSVKGTSTAGFAEALEIAKNADVVVLVCGTDLSVADEGTDRTSLDLPGVQNDLIRAVYQVNPKTILVLVTGFSLAVTWAEDSIPAILSAWYNGQAQGMAIADVLFGNYNPGGKLSTTWYRSVTDLPPMDDYNIRNNRTYMYFKGDPLYHFGHGLSYTSFGYDSLQLDSDMLNPDDSLTIRMSVTNTGEMAGDEVVQLYVHINSTTLQRPMKELKGFRRIHLNPGEKQWISFNLKHKELSYYDEKSESFRVEDGAAAILLGSSCDDIKLDSQIFVTGGIISETYRQDPFNNMEAECFEYKSPSVKLATCSEGGQSADLINQDSYVIYKNFNFDMEAHQFIARMASVAGGNVTLHVILDSLGGQLAGVITTSPSNDLSIFLTEYCELNDVTGVRDVYLVNKTPGTNTCRLNWFVFRDQYSGIRFLSSEIHEYTAELFPNPATSEVTIRYSLPEFSKVEANVYDPSGRLAGTYALAPQPPGNHDLKIYMNTLPLDPGLYIVNFRANAYSKSMMLEIIR